MRKLEGGEELEIDSSSLESFEFVTLSLLLIAVGDKGLVIGLTLASLKIKSSSITDFALGSCFLQSFEDGEDGEEGDDKNEEWYEEGS